MEQESALLNLPTDALLAVLGRLGPQDLLRCASCCRLLCTLSRSDCLWISLCSPWRHLVHLPTWRASVDHAPALFRLLSAFQLLVGPWIAQGQQLRGSLLYITWGSSCLVACKVLPCRTGDLKLTRVFEVLGLLDGSFSSLAGDILGMLVWNLRNSFTVVSNEQREDIGHQTSSGLSFSEGRLQYLIRLAAPARNSLGLEGHPNEASNMEQGGIVGCSYSRLRVPETMTKMNLVGLWMGVYGPHGTEIINVTQTHEGIFGTKVLGDPNVPAGQVSFRANCRFEITEVPVELQQIVDLQMRASFQPFNIVKLFQGYGRIAGHNFRNPLWVPGHLLLSSSGQIAFLWEDVNFLVPFERLNLAAFYQSKEHLSMVV